MNKYLIFAVVTFGVLWCLQGVEAWKPRLPIPWKQTGETFLRPGEMIRTLPGFESSNKYQFKDEYIWSLESSNVRVFGVNSEGAAAITLHDPKDGGMADLRFTLDEEGMCSAEYLLENDPVKINFQCDVVMDGQMKWFTLETTMSYVAIYANGVQDPVVDFSVNDLIDVTGVNFNKFDHYSFSSEKEAVWDSQGHSLDVHELKRLDTQNPFLKAHVKEIEDLVFEFYKVRWNCDVLQAQEPSGCRYKRYEQYCDILFADEEMVMRLETILLVNDIPLPTKDMHNAEEFIKTIKCYYYW